MNMKKTAVAVMAALALTAPLVPAPQASAAVATLSDALRVDQDDTTGAFNGSTVNAKRTASLQYSHPFSVPGKFNYFLQTDAWFGDDLNAQVQVNAENTELRALDANTVEATTRVGDVTLKRTFVFDGPTVTMDVELAGLRGQEALINLTAYQGDRDKLGYTANADGKGGYVLKPVSPGYEFDVVFGQQPTATTAQGAWEALNSNLGRGQFGAGESAIYQRGKWYTSGQDVLRAQVKITGHTQQAAADTDGDGLPDIWEDEGFTIPGANGASDIVLALPRWGARADRKDLFLQLNWLPSEWESNGCADPSRYNPVTKEYQSFEQCARYNKNTYRPSRQALLDLEQVFRAQGIELHIDAGPLYAPGIAPADRRGGQMKKYEEHIAGGDDESRVAKLQQFNRELLGDRSAVWHVGVIGDKISEGEGSSGIGLQGESFFVAKGVGLDTNAELRGTILHEFGHVLGLDHDGAPTEESRKYAAILQNSKAGERNYIPEYKSTMNYLYQFSDTPFNYSTEKVALAGRADGVLYEPCRVAGHIGELCYSGPANIEPDWENLTFRTNHIGRAEGIVGLPPVSSELIEEDITAQELTILAAEENNGRAGLTTDDRVAGGNGLVVGRPTNPITVKVANKGIDPHTFKVKALWGSGQSTTESVDLAGALDEERSVKDLQLDLGALAGTKGAKLPVDFVVTNQKGQEVFRESFQFPVLDYTPEEAAHVLEDVKADPNIADEEKQNAEDRLRPVVEANPAPSPAPTSTAASPSPTSPVLPTRTASTPIERPVDKPVVTSTGEAKPAEPETKRSSGSSESGSSSGSSKSDGIIAGVVLALVGLAAAGFGWWYNNGGKLDIPGLPF